MGLTPTTQIPGGKAEMDDAGNLTGVFTGVNATFNFFTAKIPAPTFEEQLAGTRKYFRELNRLGMTAVNDFPGGGMLPEHFRAVQTLWQNGEQTLAGDVPHLRRPARRLQGAHGVHADELRRRLAALPRHRQIAHPRHL